MGWVQLAIRSKARQLPRPCRKIRAPLCKIRPIFVGVGIGNLGSGGTEGQHALVDSGDVRGGSGSAGSRSGGGGGGGCCFGGVGVGGGGSGGGWDRDCGHTAVRLLDTRL